MTLTGWSCPSDCQPRTLCSTRERYVCSWVSSHTDTGSWQRTRVSTHTDAEPSVAHGTGMCAAVCHHTLTQGADTEPSIAHWTLCSTQNPLQHIEPSAAHGTGMCAAECYHTLTWRPDTYITLIYYDTPTDQSTSSFFFLERENELETVQQFNFNFKDSWNVDFANTT